MGRFLQQRVRELNKCFIKVMYRLEQMNHVVLLKPFTLVFLMQSDVMTGTKTQHRYPQAENPHPLPPFTQRLSFTHRFTSITEDNPITLMRLSQI